MSSRSEQNADRTYYRAALRGAAAAAVLAACATGGPVFAQEATRPTAAPQTTEGPAVILEADQLIDDREHNQIIAEGHVEARYEGRTLRAERLVYDTEKRTVRAQGKVEILDEDGSVRFADEIEVDEDLNAGVATGFGARLPGGGTVAAASGIRRPDGVNELNRVIYSACPVCKNGSPAWSLRARKAMQNPNTDMISYRDVMLQVRGVPVIYLPYFAHPDPSAGRRSGLLAPDFGRKRRLGTFLEIPYYWAISPSQDLTIGPRLHTKVNPLLDVGYRKRFWSGAMSFDGSVTYEQDFDGDGEKFGEETWRSHLFGSGDFRLSDYWDWGFSVARASDDLYLKRYGIPGGPTSRGLLRSDLSRLFSTVDVTGQDERSFASLSLVTVQGLREGDTEAELPLVLPVGEAERVYRDPLFDGQFRVQLSTANLVRGDGVDSARITAGGKWGLERAFGPGIVFGPFAEARTDLYRVANYNGNGEDTVSRTLGLAGAELRWPFVRPGDRVDFMIEPIAMAAIGSSGGEDNRIPNEDSLAFELDESNLFRANVVPNYDLWESGARLSAGVRTSAVTDVGSASFMFGRRWRADDDSAFAPSTNLDGNASDWVGSVTADLGPRFGGTVRFRLDDEALQVNRLDATLRGNIWRLSARARYFSVDQELAGGNPSEEIAGSLGLRLTKNWSTAVGLRRDLDSAINLSQDARLTYRDDCTFLEFVYSRTETRDGPLGPSEGFQIRIGLSTLGMMGGE